MREESNSGAATPLNGRETAVLQGVLEAYLASGAPVGSRTLAERQPQSPSSATIRHVLAELERIGYLSHPHTSAGRVPTSKAIRWWLQQLGAPTPVAGDFAPEEALRLERAMREASDEATLWLLVSEFLSDASHQIGVVAVQPWHDAGLRQLRFFRLTDHRVLAILVASDGQVRERVGRVPEPYTQTELDAAARYFNLNFNGLTLARIRRDLRHRIEEERAAYDELLKRVVVLSHCGVLEMQNEGEVYIQGTRHLAECLEGEKLGAMLERLNQKERWLHLLMGMSAETGKEAAGGDSNLVEWDSGAVGSGPRRWVRVRVGLDDEALPEFSLITANHRQGAVGILGSTRMEYQRALHAVAWVGELFHRYLGENPS